MIKSITFFYIFISNLNLIDFIKMSNSDANSAAFLDMNDDKPKNEEELASQPFNATSLVRQQQQLSK